MEVKHKNIISSNMKALLECTEEVDSVMEGLIKKEILNKHITKQIEEEKSIDEKKKLFYEKIQRRGPTAFRELYDTLMEEKYYSPANILRTGLADELTLIKSRRRMDTDLEKAYRMISDPKGYALIINIKKFNTDNEERDGSDKDEANLHKLLEFLGYVVIVHRDLNTEEFMSEVSTFAKMKKHNDVDSTIVVVMTHGNMNKNNSKHIDLQTSLGKDIKSSWIIDQFCIKNCEYLKNKPKLFFFQTCRGEEYNIGVFADGGIENIPDDADILVAYATTPGHSAPRSVKYGSPFIQKICKIFGEKAFNTDVSSMLSEVSKQLRNERDKRYGFQIVHVENSYFDKKLYFNPGLSA